MKSSNLKIAGVVVLYHPSDDLITNINSYLPQIHHLYAVDNTETPIGGSMLTQLKKMRKVELITNGANLGIASALNIAAEKAIKKGYDFLLTMDQDSIVPDNMVKDLIYFTEKNGYDLNKVGIIAPFPYDKAKPKIPNKEVEKELCVLTSGDLLNLHAFKKIGPFMGELFIDRVDDEYCLRLNMNGYHVLRVDRVVMNHNLGDITEHRLFWRRQIVTNHSALRRYYITRNSLYVSKKYEKIFPQYKKEQLASFFFEITKIILFEKNKLPKLKNIIRGYNDYKHAKMGKMETAPSGK